MPLDTYANLQRSVLDWLARPDDPLVAPAVPDMILMFEEEARDRLKTRFQETKITILPLPNSELVPLPDDFVSMRELYVTEAAGNRHFQYQGPRNLDTNLWTYPGYTVAFTIEGLNLRMTGNSGDSPAGLEIVYMQGLPPLSDAVPTNWLLTRYPSLYLWGSLTFAGLYIADDERVGTWVQAREAAFQRIQTADLKAKYPDGLMIQTDVRNP